MTTPRLTFAQKHDAYNGRVGRGPSAASKRRQLEHDAAVAAKKAIKRYPSPGAAAVAERLRLAGLAKA